MQTCPECGGRNEDGELFCGTCGSYLEWEETQAAAAVTVEDDGGRGGGPGPDPVADTPGGESQELAGETSPAEPGVTGADAGTDAGTDEPADPAPDAPAEEARPAERPAAAAAAGTAPLGGLAGRAARAARRAADQATGGAVTSASSTATRARSEASNATRSPGRAAAQQAARAAGGGPLAGAAAAAAREVPTRTSGRGGPPLTAQPVPEARSAPVRERTAATGAATDEGKAPPAGPTRPGPARPARPAPVQPAARKPGAPVQRRPVPRVQEEEPPPRPGELICGACGAGNAPHRHFCRRCGADLTDAPVQPQRSWWRRLLRPDPRPGPAAGTRPRTRRRRRFPTGLVVTLVVLALLAGGAWYARDSVAGAYAAVVDRVAGDDPINPAGVTASSERAERPASHVRDGIVNRSWAPEGEGPGEWVELALPEPARLVTVLVTAGNGGEEGEWLLEARPSRLRLTMTTTQGEEVRTVDLTDTREAQPVPVGVSDVETLRVTILSVFGEELEAPVAVAEVELLGRG